LIFHTLTEKVGEKFKENLNKYLILVKENLKFGSSGIIENKVHLPN